MDISVLTQIFTEYGLLAIFVIVFLEYLNLPGFPAGVIMPLAGVMASKGEINFILVMVVSVLAGMVGSWLLYFLGKKGGKAFLDFYFKKFPKQQPVLERNIEWLKSKGTMGVFFGKLIPAVRTLVSIPAGVLQMDFAKYTISSICGIVIWNFVFVGAGYILGDAVFSLFA